MTEKKPLQPLLLFFISSILSFLTGIFVGIMIVPHFMDEAVDSSEVISEEDLELSEDDSDLNEVKAENIENQKENKALNRYKNMLKKSIDDPSQNAEFFKTYGVVVGSYSNIDKANNVAIDLKSQYNWTAAVYPMDNFYKVIIGPFDNQKSAQSFLEQMPKISRFITAKTIEFPTD